MKKFKLWFISLHLFSTYLGFIIFANIFDLQGNNLGFEEVFFTILFNYSLMILIYRFNGIKDYKYIAYFNTLIWIIFSLIFISSLVIPYKFNLGIHPGLSLLILILGTYYISYIFYDFFNINRFSGIKTDKNDFQEIIRDYGSLMVEIDDAGVAIYDENLLPYSKAEIREALIKGYKLTNNEDQKNALLVSMENLGWFQKDIGKVPLRGFTDYSNMSADEVFQSSNEIDNDSNINKEKYEEMSLKAEKEYADILKLL